MAMRSWMPVVGSCLGGAIGAGVLWAFLNGVWTINGVGLLERQGWPLDDVVIFAGVGAVAGLFNGLRRSAREREHGLEVAELCEGSGLRYTAEAMRADLPEIPLLEGWSEGRHLMSGERGGVPVRVLDVTTVVERQESREARHRTVALVPAEGLPAFDLRPRTRAMRLLGMAGVEGVTFDPMSVADPAAADAVTAFGQLFHLMPSGVVPSGVLGTDFAPEVEDSEQALRRFFTPDLMGAFNRHPGHSAQAAAGSLAVWRGESFLPARERTELLETALALRAALTRTAAAHEAGGAQAVVAALPSTDPESQAARLRNTVVGAVAGFFLGFGIGTAAVFSRPLPKNLGNAGWVALAVPNMVFGSVALGVALGAFLGSRVPVRPLAASHAATVMTPLQRAARRKLTTAGTVAGLVLGSLGGFAAFASVLFGFRAKAPDSSLMAVLFFGSVGLGAAVGAFLGGAAARFLYDHRRTRGDAPVTGRVPNSPSEMRSR
jgi:hypothetical protein